MNADTFIRLAGELTGTPVKDVTGTDREFLDRALADDAQQMTYSLLNELLLLVNKDRMGRAFFDRFFGPTCNVGTLQVGVAAFRKLAMLCHGNFVYSYRTMCQAPSKEALLAELAEWARDPTAIKAALTARSGKLLDISLIPRADTPLVGYISAGEIIAEDGRCALLRGQVPDEAALPEADWPSYEERVTRAANDAEHPALTAVIANYRKKHDGATVAEFATYLSGVAEALALNMTKLGAVRATATKNQSVYLTWDHMDVYFATSMRKRWEFEALFDFVSGLVAAPQLAGLNLRHFDPTQAFTEDRIAKGLVESLMLKRACCTVYSVQDTDTLGKDSELAATLAQGKPVIAYIPTIDVAARAEQLAAEDPTTIQERLRFVLYADDRFAQSVGPEDYEFVRGFQPIEQFEKDRIWRTAPDQAAIDAFRAEHGEGLKRLARAIAASEAQIYERRANRRSIRPCRDRPRARAARRAAS